MKTVLFGNGLNRLSKHSITWNQLLDKIKGEHLFENGKLPNTMIYERSIIGNPISFDTLTQKEESIKTEIADMLKTFPSNRFHEKLASLNVENYITTNYDYAFLNYFEEASSFEVKDKSTEGIYSLRRYKEIIQNNEVRSKVWHIHGEIGLPPSIMLGLDHYCGSISKIDQYVKGRYEFQVNNAKIKAHSIIDKLKGKNKYDNVSWIELFFNSEVHIIGFGLDFSEIDLWWVLNKRARFKLDNETKSLVNNNIYYYYTKKEVEEEEEKNRSELLKILGINVIKIELGKGSDKYEKAYEEIFNMI